MENEHYIRQNYILFLLELKEPGFGSAYHLTYKPSSLRPWMGQKQRGVTEIGTRLYNVEYRNLDDADLEGRWKPLIWRGSLLRPFHQHERDQRSEMTEDPRRLLAVGWQCVFYGLWVYVMALSGSRYVVYTTWRENNELQVYSQWCKWNERGSTTASWDSHLLWYDFSSHTKMLECQKWLVVHW